MGAFRTGLPKVRCCSKGGGQRALPPFMLLPSGQKLVKSTHASCPRKAEMVKGYLQLSLSPNLYLPH